MKKIGIIGLGNFGYALLAHFDTKNKGRFDLKAYDRNKEIIDHLKRYRKHPVLYSSVTLSQTIEFTNNLEFAVTDREYIILAVSSSAVREIIAKIKPYLKSNVIIVNTAKALDYQTGQRYSQIAGQTLSKLPYIYALLAGGTIAKDLFREDPLGATIACQDKTTLTDLAGVFNSYNISIYQTNDLAGVEYAAAFKNVISILAGIIKGMGFSYGSETYIISRAANEVEELVVNNLGGKPETFSMESQCWGNDLWMSCTGNTRNKEFGELIGKGNSVTKALKMMEKQNKTVEGIHTIQVLDKIADLQEYPLLKFLHEFFSGKKQLPDIKPLIFNHEF